MGTFNPTARLEAFAADGGAYTLAPDGRLWLGLLTVAAANVERSTAELVGHPERREGIVTLIRERCLIA